MSKGHCNTLVACTNIAVLSAFGCVTNHDGTDFGTAELMMAQDIPTAYIHTYIDTLYVLCGWCPVSTPSVLHPHPQLSRQQRVVIVALAVDSQEQDTRLVHFSPKAPMVSTEILVFENVEHFKRTRRWRVWRGCAVLPIPSAQRLQTFGFDFDVGTRWRCSAHTIVRNRASACNILRQLFAWRARPQAAATLRPVQCVAAFDTIADRLTQSWIEILVAVTANIWALSICVLLIDGTVPSVNVTGAVNVIHLTQYWAVQTNSDSTE
jgi:hypothetical protein